MLNLVLPIVAAGAMPYLLTLISKANNFGHEENRRTRDWQAQLTGWRQRAYWAHLNSFEAFPFFAALAILAHLAQPSSVIAAYASWAFVALRILYAAAFLADRASLRSVIWCGAMGALVPLILVALRIL